MARRLPDPRPRRPSLLEQLMGLRSPVDASRVAPDTTSSVSDILRRGSSAWAPPEEEEAPSLLRNTMAADASRVRPPAAPSIQEPTPVMERHTPNRTVNTAYLEDIAFGVPKTRDAMLERGLNIASFGLGRPLGGAISSAIQGKTRGVDPEALTAARNNRADTFARNNPDDALRADIWGGLAGFGAEEFVARGGAKAVGKSMQRMASNEFGSVGRRPADLAARDAGDFADMGRASRVEARPTPESYLDDIGQGRIGRESGRDPVTPAMRNAVGGEDATVARIERMAAEGKLQRPIVRLAEMERVGAEIGLDGFNARKAAGMTSAEMAERVRVLKTYPRLAGELEVQLADNLLTGEARQAAVTRLSYLEEEIKAAVGRVVVGGGDAGRTLAYLRWRGRDVNSDQFWLTQAARRVKSANGDWRHLPEEVSTKIRAILNKGRAKVKGASGLDDPARVNLDKPTQPKDIGAGSTQLERMSEEGLGADGLFPRAPMEGIERADELDLSGVMGSGSRAENPEAYAGRMAARDAREELARQQADEVRKVSLDPKARPDDLPLDARAGDVQLGEGLADDALTGVTGGGKTGFREIVPENAQRGTARLTREAAESEDAIRARVMKEQGITPPPRPDTERVPTKLERAIAELPEETQRELATYVRSLRKSYFGEKVIDQWRANLLSWVQTTVLNIGSNTVKGNIETLIEKPLAAVFDAAYVAGVRATGREATRSVRWAPSHVLRYYETGFDATKQASGYNTFKATYEELRAAGKGRLAATGGGAKKAIQEVATPHGDLSVLEAMERPDVVYGDGALGRILEMNRNLIFGSLGKQDVPFRLAAQARIHMELAELRAVREGLELGTEAATKRVTELTSLKGAEASDMVLAIAKAAEDEARNAVFMGKNRMSDLISTGKRLSSSENLGERLIGYTTNSLMPFSQVPTNLVSQTVAGTPLGILSPAMHTKALNELTKATGLPMRQRAFVTAAARSSTGTGFMLLGAALERQGMMSLSMPFGGGEQGLFRQENRMSNAVKVGGEVAKWVSLITLGPYGMLMAMGAQMQKALTESAGEGGLARGAKLLGAAGQGLGETLMEAPMMQGMEQLHQGIKGQGNVVASRVGSFVPSWVGGIARGLDPVQDRDTRDDFFGPAKARIPGLRETLPLRRSPMGDAAFKGAPGGAERMVREALDPQRSRPVRNDPLTKELVRLQVPVTDLARGKASQARYLKDGTLRPEKEPEPVEAYRARREWVDPRVRLGLARFVGAGTFQELGWNPDRQRDLVRAELESLRARYNDQYAKRSLITPSPR